MTTSIKTFDILPNHHEEIHMDIEQLKLILELVKGVSGDAQTVAIAWILVSHVLPYIFWGIFGTFSVITVSKLIVNLNENENDYEFFKECRMELNTGSGGALTADEKRRTKKAILKLLPSN